MEDADDCFLVEGRWAVEALLEDTGFEVRSITVENARHGELVVRARARGIRVDARSRAEICEDRGFVFHRGVYACVSRPALSEPGEEEWSRVKALVVPYALADPGNLGNVVRAAVGFGADAVAIPKGLGADLFNRKCIRASATALFRIPLFAFRDPGRFLEDLRERGFVRFATSLGEGSRDLRSVAPAEKMAVFFGSEGSGLPAEVEHQCEEKVKIPMASELDSLNVGSSAAVVLHELFRDLPGRL